MNRNTTDLLNLLSKLTGARLLNLVKLYSSYTLSKLSKKNVHWGQPASIEIEPTTSCNLRCTQCPSGLRSFTRETGMLNFELFQKVMDEVHHELLYLVLYFQGEPFLNTRILDFVQYAHHKNVYTEISSNAHYFTDEVAKQTVLSGLDRLIISIDGTTQESYEKYRIGGNLQKVMDGTQRIMEWKKKLGSNTPHVIWQFVVFKHNEHQVPQLKKMAHEMGVDEVAIKTAQIYDFQNNESLIPDNKNLSRYKLTNNGYQIKNKLLNHCWKLWKGSVVTWNGNVIPCCFDKDAKYQFGNVLSTSFNQIWTNPKYHSFRANIIQSRKSIDICTNCTEGTKVWS